MRRLALGFGCVMLLACGGYAEDELPIDQHEQAAIVRAKNLLGHDPYRPVGLQAALRAQHELANADSTALDLERYALHQDEVCGGQQCPVARDVPCKVHWYSVWHQNPVPVCACDHRGYLFPCR